MRVAPQTCILQAAAATMKLMIIYNIQVIDSDNGNGKVVTVGDIVPCHQHYLWPKKVSIISILGTLCVKRQNLNISAEENM
jgi:hypothetical protein